MRLFIAALLIILICTFSVVADAQAAPDHMTISAKDWMVANGMDSSTITVTVYDIAGNPLPVTTVTYKGTAPWTFSAMSGVTDSFGRTTTVLQPTTKSGADLITVNASVVEAGVLHSIEQTYTQNIDHSTPQTAVPTYDLNVSVGTTTLIQVKVTDASGKPVDNRNVVETVQFTASGSTDSGFWDGAAYVKILTVPVDSDGFVRATYLVTKSGTNFVDIQPPAPILHKLIIITGTNDGSPYAITQAVSPGGYPYPYTKTDGSKFRVVYTLLDQFGNPSGNRGIKSDHERPRLKRRSSRPTTTGSSRITTRRMRPACIPSRPPPSIMRVSPPPRPWSSSPRIRPPCSSRRAPRRCPRGT